MGFPCISPSVYPSFCLQQSATAMPPSSLSFTFSPRCTPIAHMQTHTHTTQLKTCNDLSFKPKCSPFTRMIQRSAPTKRQMLTCNTSTSNTCCVHLTVRVAVRTKAIFQSISFSFAATQLLCRHSANHPAPQPANAANAFPAHHHVATAEPKERAGHPPPHHPIQRLAARNTRGGFYDCHLSVMHELWDKWRKDRASLLSSTCLSK